MFIFMKNLKLKIKLSFIPNTQIYHKFFKFKYYLFFIKKKSESFYKN